MTTSGDRDADIDLDVKPLPGIGPIVDTGGGMGPAGFARLRDSRLMRPWPRPYLVLVTAVVTAVAVTTTLNRADAVEEPVATLEPEGWLIDRSPQVPVPSGNADGLSAAEGAAQDPPASIDGNADYQVVTVETATDSLAGLPPGMYDMYATCRSAGRPPITVVVQIEATGDVRMQRNSVTCAPGPAAWWPTITFDDYGAVTVTTYPAEGFEGDPDRSSYGVALFIVEH